MTDPITCSTDPFLPFDHRSAARDALRGLAVGDAFGAQFFVPENLAFLRGRRLPPGVWPWTDDTEMACSVFGVGYSSGRCHCFAGRPSGSQAYSARRILPSSGAPF